MNLFSEKSTEVLRDIRLSLIRIIVICAALFLAALFFVEPIMRELSGIISTKLILYSLPEAFMSYLKAAFLVSLMVIVPYVMTETVRIVRRHVDLGRMPFYALVAAGTGLFYCGVVFCYFIVLPSGIKFLLQYQTENIKPMISVSSFISFVFTFLFVFGAMFELPLIMAVLGKIGVVNTKLLNKQRRFFILANAILSALLTPTPDMFNMMLMMVPMQVLYEVGVIIVAITGKARLQKADTGV